MNINIILFGIFLLFRVVLGLEAKNAKHCFDVLDELPTSEIQKIYFMNFKEVALTHPANDIFSCFLRKSNTGDKSLIEQYFNVFKKCNEYRENNLQSFGNQQLEELVSLGLPYYLETYLQVKMKTGNREQLEQGITHVQDVMSKDIELSQDYKDYKHFILEKYQPSTQREL